MGAIITPMPHTAMARPRWRSGKISHIVAWAIGTIGPPPSPWRIRIATRNSRLGARPDSNELTVKRVVQIRKSRRRPSTPVSHPVAGITMALAARYDVITHDVSSMLVDSVPCMWGRATLVMLVSRICMIVMSMTEPVMAHFRVEESAIDGWTGSGTFAMVARAARGKSTRPSQSDPITATGDNG